MVVWLSALALAQGLDSRARLADALLLESQGNLEAAIAQYRDLTRNLALDDAIRAEALYWLGHGLWSDGQHDEARKVLIEGIRTGGCPQCRDLLEVIEFDARSVHQLPLRADFEQDNEVLFHPWRVGALGQIRVGVGPRGDMALEWATTARPGEPDRLVMGLKQPTPAPEVLEFSIQSARLDAMIDVVGVDDRGRTFGLREPVPARRGVQQRVTVPLERLHPADGGAPLRPESLVLLSIVDRTATRVAGENQFWIDDLELR